MRGFCMLVGLIIANLTLTANLAGAPRPQQEKEHGAAPEGGAPQVESPHAKHKDVPRLKQGERPAKPESGFSSTGKQFLSDQKAIWTSPARLRWSDTEWIIPVAGITTGMIFTDASLSRSLSYKPATLHHFNDIRTGGVAALGAVSGG